MLDSNKTLLWFQILYLSPFLVTVSVYMFPWNVFLFPCGGDEVMEICVYISSAINFRNSAMLLSAPEALFICWHLATAQIGCFSSFLTTDQVTESMMLNCGWDISPHLMKNAVESTGILKKDDISTQWEYSAWLCSEPRSQSIITNVFSARLKTKNTVFTIDFQHMHFFKFAMHG